MRSRLRPLARWAQRYGWVLPTLLGALPFLLGLAIGLVISGIIAATVWTVASATAGFEAGYRFVRGR
jgi:hypothetical protein